MSKSNNSFEDLRRKAKETAPLRWSRKELALIGLLKDAHQESIAPILRDSPVRVLANGDVLLRAGDSCNAVFMVLSGQLEIADPAVPAPRVSIKAGDSIGEMFLREKVGVAHSIVAVEPTRVLVIYRDVAWALIRKSHEIARNWLSVLSGRTHVCIDVSSRGADTTVHAAPRTHDELTGLYNRRWLETMLPRQIARASTGNEALALVLVEIDGFDHYTDRLGQDTANLAYQAVAQTIVLNVRPTDIVVSYAAGQFAALLPASDAAGACIVGERIRGAISKAGALAPDENVLHSLTISVGIAESKPFTEASALLAAAEGALDLAKSRGGDRVAMQ